MHDLDKSSHCWNLVNGIILSSTGGRLLQISYLLFGCTNLNTNIFLALIGVDHMIFSRGTDAGPCMAVAAPSP